MRRPAVPPAIQISGPEGRMDHYIRAVERAGGAPVPGYAPEPDSHCLGLVLCGGGDLDPAWFGQEDRGSHPPDSRRDAAELALVRTWLSWGRPILGICRGMQVINVFFGGTLVQDLPGHGQAAGRDRLHRVRSAPSPLRDLYGAAAVVNSAHHQAADRLGSGLRAVQWTADGTVEAVVHEDLPVWAVQWHPERLSGPLALAGAADGGRLFTAWLSLAAPG